MYRLKENQPELRVMDGKFAGRRYEHGQTYPEIPPEEKDRFEKVPQPKKAAKSAKTEEDNPGGEA